MLVVLSPMKNDWVQRMTKRSNWKWIYWQFVNDEQMFTYILTSNFYLSVNCTTQANNDEKAVWKVLDISNEGNSFSLPVEDDEEEKFSSCSSSRSSSIRLCQQTQFHRSRIEIQNSNRCDGISALFDQQCTEQVNGCRRMTFFSPLSLSLLFLFCPVVRHLFIEDIKTVPLHLFYLVE